MKPKAKVARARPAKEQILRAARELFAERGFRDTTVREIARRACVNGAAINYYFDSKEALYVAGVLLELIRMSMPDAPPEAVHAAFITTMSQCAVFMHRDPPWEDFEISPLVPRETWIRMVRDEIVANVCARRSFVRRP